MMRKLLVTILCSGIVSLSFGQEMVKVVGGTFVMGSNDLIDNEYSTDSSGPPHSVTLSSFSIGKYEITYEQWIEVSTWGLLHGYSDLAEAQNGYEPVGSNNPVTKDTSNANYLKPSD